MRRRLVSGDQAKQTARQHTKPCGDCPFRRDALRGWLGDSTADEWVRMLHGETRILCHTKVGPQCVGAAIYRRNVAKQARDPKDLCRVVAPDRAKVFATPMEFLAYHTEEGSDEDTAPAAASDRAPDRVDGARAVAHRQAQRNDRGALARRSDAAPRRSAP